jgi:hypothetical protein
MSKMQFFIFRVGSRIWMSKMQFRTSFSGWVLAKNLDEQNAIQNIFFYGVGLSEEMDEQNLIEITQNFLLRGGSKRKICRKLQRGTSFPRWVPAKNLIEQNSV